jgi:hypothetical protein
MKKVLMLLGLVLVISGCSIQPTQYDLSASGDFTAIEKKQDIPKMEVVNFKYEPHIKISQNTISAFGCIPCQADGSTAGIVYTTPINEIVKAEVEKALKEVTTPTVLSSCQLGATIHTAAWNVWDGETTLDMTFMLIKEDQIKFFKRIRGSYDGGIFGGPDFNRVFVNASRKAVSLLVTNNDFLNEVDKSCTVSSL